MIDQPALLDHVTRGAFRIVMGAAVDLNDKARPDAGEVGEPWADRHLATKMGAAAPMGPQGLP